MPLLSGRLIGPYEVLEPIGSGGMGEVYRARDLKLDRDVALKFLPAPLRSDSDRLSRFAREARSLAALNHPNIGAIYGFEETEDVKALALEFVEGPTLADRIARGPIPIDEALAIGRQIADALESAHERGIVHRDLKPANIKVRPDDTVKVLDFGLAKALEPVVSVGGQPTTSPTLTSPALTQMGVLLGTAAYMSPEQAKGRQADKRSDLWAFGCVMHEMLTGKRAFAGEDVSDTLAAVLRGEPDWTAWPSNTPTPIRRLLRRCLEKDHKSRLDSALVARLEIDEALANPIERSPTMRRAEYRRERLAWALVVVTGIAAYAAWTARPASSPPTSLARFTIPLPTGDHFSNFGVHVVALSTDGSRLVYVANERLYMRRMDQLDAAPVRGAAGTGAAAPRNPLFSPDGQWIGFWQEGQLKKVSVDGGAPIVLCAAENPWGASWTTDNTILYGQNQEGFGLGGIWRVSGNGGKPERLVTVEADLIADGPQLLPGGRAVLFTLTRKNDRDAAQIVVQSLGTQSRRIVVDRGAAAHYVATGHLVYALGGTVLAAPFDVKTLAVTGGALPLVEDVAQVSVTAHFAISSQGALAYVPRDGIGAGARQQQRTLAWIDRQGREDPIKAPPRAYIYPRLSPDGTRVALEIREPPSDIWIWDLAHETLRRLTFEPTFDQNPVWTADGRGVIFGSSATGGPASPRSLFRRAADGTGVAEQLTRGTVAQFASAVTPDGSALIFREATPSPRLGAPPGTDLLLLPLTGEQRPRPLVQTPFDELNAEISPDGRWLAYQSNESGRHEIFVRPFPNVEAGKWQVSTNGGSQPLWARSGRELFYVSMGELMRVPLKIGSIIEAGMSTKLFGGPYLVGPPPGGGLGRMYDVSPDGQRFLVIKDRQGGDDDARPRIILVQNWLDELKRRVPSNK